MKASKTNWLDRAALAVSPGWGFKRLQNRVAADMIVRHFEAAESGRRTDNWRRTGADANAAAGPAIPILRAHARDLVRNNAWAKNALRIVSTDTVGWGIGAKALGPAADDAAAIWKRWAGTTECDADGRLTFAGLQSLAMRSIAESGEVLFRKRPRRKKDNLTIPVQLQLLESDFLDTAKYYLSSEAGGPIIQGVEFDKLGRRAAYWIFPKHPGSAMLATAASSRIPADEIIHVFYPERPGQVRGLTWLGIAILNLKDFDEYEDASLMRQKIAACFAAFVTDVDGSGVGLGEPEQAVPSIVETLEPGMVNYLKPGQEVTFAAPPVSESGGFTERQLRRIAAGIGITYEGMTGDYSSVNFSSARMSRIKQWANIHDWRWNMLIPMMCDGVWNWMTEAAQNAGLLPEDNPPAAEWTAPPMPMIEPDREGLALVRLVRSGAMTPDEMVREQGLDPDTHWEEYAAGLERLDALGITLDSDARKTTQAGLAQSTGAKPDANKEAPAAES